MDGRSAWQRFRADPTFPEQPCFCENVPYKPAKTVAIPKDDPRWRSWIWVGLVDHTSEQVTLTPDGALKCHAIRRQESTEQLNAESINQVRSPWQPVPGRDSLKIPDDI